MSSTTLFVYGTLKRGGRSHHLLADQEFVGEAETLPFYRLYDCGDHPALVEDRQHGISVCGELWRVAAAALARLDAYEEVPTLFRRCAIAVVGNSSPVAAYLYQGDASMLENCGRIWPAG